MVVNIRLRLLDTVLAIVGLSETDDDDDDVSSIVISYDAIEEYIFGLFENFVFIHQLHQDNLLYSLCAFRVEIYPLCKQRVT